ncbi:MAG: hypothetical protein CMF51_05505 [Legionellales bacterium]|nr:hypothetical protein [Legionellales bacterium]
MTQLSLLHQILIPALLMLPNFSYANVKISPQLATLSDHSKRFKYTIHNTSALKAYIKMKAMEIQCPDHKLACMNPQLVETEFSKKLLFSPSRFILPKHSTRIILARWPETLPKTPKMIEIQPINHNPESIQKLKRNIKNQAGQPISLNLNIRVLYVSRLLLQAHQTRQQKPSITLQKNQINWFNPGTAPMLIKVSTHCHEDSKCNLTTLDEVNKKNIRMLYPQQTVAMKINPNQVVELYYFKGKNQKWTHLKTL